MFKMRQAFSEGCRWVIGDGQVRFWTDNGLGPGPLRSLLPEDTWVDNELRVQDLIREDGSWDLQHIHQADLATYISSFLPRRPSLFQAVQLSKPVP